MSNCVINTIFSGLSGEINTNPKIYRVYPDKLKAGPEELLEKFMPLGCRPGEFFVSELNNKKILVYVFEIEHEDGRNSIASIGFTLDVRTIIPELKEIVVELIERMRESGILNFGVLELYLDKITEGLQKESKKKIGPMIFDVGFFILSKKMKLQKVNRRARKGGLI